MQGTWVRALVREDPTCRGATKPVCHNYWACALEPASHNYWACMLQQLKLTCLEPVLHNKRSLHNEKPMHCSPQLEKARSQQRRPHAAKNKLKKKKSIPLKGIVALKVLQESSRGLAPFSKSLPLTSTSEKDAAPGTAAQNTPAWAVSADPGVPAHGAASQNLHTANSIL